jgi:hypothetical protein
MTQNDAIISQISFISASLKLLADGKYNPFWVNQSETG